MYIFFFQTFSALHIFWVLQNSLVLCLCDCNLKHSKKMFISSSMFVLASLKVDKGSGMIGGSLIEPLETPSFSLLLLLRDVPDISPSAPCSLLAVIWWFAGWLWLQINVLNSVGQAGRSGSQTLEEEIEGAVANNQPALQPILALSPHFNQFLSCVRWRKHSRILRSQFLSCQSETLIKDSDLKIGFESTNFSPG